MGVKLKSLTEQVIVITGASSGIGLTTAKAAARGGAKVVLVARSEDALRDQVRSVRDAGGTAEYCVADVAKPDELRRAAQLAIEKFGRIDTWVNNAGVSIYGRVADVSVDDDRRLFDTNFWGVVNGSRLALEFMKDGGALINVGSVVSDRAIPIQGMYSASKHAVLGFTDALRMEVADAGLPISVTLIKPSAINTPYPSHAKNYMDKEADLPSPIYAPELVADMILFAAQNPARELYVGGGGRMLSAFGRQAPGLMDKIMQWFMIDQQHSDRPATNREGALHSPSNDPRMHGDGDKRHMVRTHSLYNTLERHPLLAIAAVGAIGAVAGLVIHEILAEDDEPTYYDRAKEIGRRGAQQFSARASELSSHASDLGSKANDWRNWAQHSAADWLSRSAARIGRLAGRN